MASEIDICNMALSHIGQSAIGSLIERSVPAIACNMHYATQRDVLLEESNWTFAEKTRALAELASDRAEWAYMYAIPTDCLRINHIYNDEVGPDGNLYEYKVAGDNVYAMLPQAIAIYTVKLTDVNKFPKTFINALSWRLAASLAPSIVKDTAIIRLAEQKAAFLVAQAIANDAQQETRIESHMPSHLGARYG